MEKCRIIEKKYLMKKALTIGTFLLVSTLTMNVMAQEKNSIEVKKEVIIEDENGEMKLIIRTTSGTMSSQEVYTGEEAKAKLAEIDNNQEQETSLVKETDEEILINEVDGQRELRIKTTENGVVKEEVYIGEAAEKKIKELEETKTVKTTEKRIEKRKVVNAVE